MKPLGLVAVGILLSVVLTGAAVRQKQGSSGGGSSVSSSSDGNHDVRLLAAWVSDKRGGNLMAWFVPVNTGKGVTASIVTRPAEARAAGVVRITFPAHSHTPHEKALMKIIRDSVPDHRSHLIKPPPAKREAIFSIPRSTRTNYVTDYTKWRFVGFGKQ